MYYESEQAKQARLTYEAHERRASIRYALFFGGWALIGFGLIVAGAVGLYFGSCVSC